ncbi:hypothetical protein [Halalkalibacter hemicellulosilyticus]|uniref:Uncharacterized protein n=1 Tax=Halalkalibacter hemicellulosilyticusJCM 9152 TaxID=1236971 RepID=W4QFD3_9BACI|nr:hypothetical protein [Halalkalibacter hemicellulosilyticus]GAE30637.1 hypothetical protein JCM9152_2051 [Halalkalibacter hemicellulosilyticusJCM 9152]
MNESLQRLNTICIIILAFFMLFPVFIWLFTGTPFVESYQLFPLDLSLFFAILLGAVIVNYTIKSSKLLITIMGVALASLIVYYLL